MNLLKSLRQILPNLVIINNKGEKTIQNTQIQQPIPTQAPVPAQQAPIQQAPIQQAPVQVSDNVRHDEVIAAKLARSAQEVLKRSSESGDINLNTKNPDDFFGETILGRVKSDTRNDLRGSLVRSLQSIATNFQNKQQQPGLIERALGFLKNLATGTDKHTAKQASSAVTSIARGHVYGIEGGATKDENDFVPSIQALAKPVLNEIAQVNPKEVISSTMRESWNGTDNELLAGLIKTGLNAKPLDTLRAIDANLSSYDRDYGDNAQKDLATLKVISQELQNVNLGTEHANAVLAEVGSLIAEKERQSAQEQQPVAPVNLVTPPASPAPVLTQQVAADTVLAV